MMGASSGITMNNQGNNFELQSLEQSLQELKKIKVQNIQGYQKIQNEGGVGFNELAKKYDQNMGIKLLGDQK